MLATVTAWTGNYLIALYLHSRPVLILCCPSEPSYQ